MSEIKIEPCPFCGSDKVKIRPGDYGVFAECQGCGNRSVTVKLSSDYSAKTVAIIAWNRRPCAKPGVLVTEEQLEQIRKKFWSYSDAFLGNDMIEINEAYGIVCECIGYEEE
mgnify:CR=1 FL=1